MGVMGKSVKRTAGLAGLAAAVLVLATTPARAAVSAETAFVFNTFAFLVSGFLVMWMAAGFAMLEAGLVRQHDCIRVERNPLVPAHHLHRQEVQRRALVVAGIRLTVEVVPHRSGLPVEHQQHALVQPERLELKLVGADRGIEPDP